MTQMSDLTTTKVQVIQPQETLRQAALLMQRLDVDQAVREIAQPDADRVAG